MSILIALLLPFGFRLDRQLPRKVQMDWEAILTPNPRAFTSRLDAWLTVALQPIDEIMSETETDRCVMDTCSSLLRSLPLVGETFPTLRSALHVLGQVDDPDL